VETVEIWIEVTTDRTIPGTLGVYRGIARIAGPFRCLAKSDNLAAAQAGNPTRDPLKRMGDAPLGRSSLTLCAPGLPLRSYGPGKRYLLTGTTGDALTARKNGRTGIMIHGGVLTIGGALRPTHGCVRVDDSTITAIVSLGCQWATVATAPFKPLAA
jgi:hypothetical protein